MITSKQIGVHLHLPALALTLIAACVSTPRLPRWTPVTDDYYPPVSRRLGEQGRVLVEFRLNRLRQPLDLTIPEADPSLRLKDGAMKVVMGLHFDPSDKTKPNEKHTYRVTVIFCLGSDDCNGAPSFPGTESVIVRAPAPREGPIRIPAPRSF